jgi:hypothetical protein
MRYSFSKLSNPRHNGAGEDRQYRTFANRDPASSRSPGSQQDTPLFGGAPARPVINRQEVTQCRVLRSVINDDEQAPNGTDPHPPADEQGATPRTQIECR